METKAENEEVNKIFHNDAPPDESTRGEYYVFTNIATKLSDLI